MAQGVGRPRRGRAVILSETTVVDAAQDLVHREGVDAVSMRRVADRLGTGQASLYAYVSGRDELLAAVLERALGSVALPDPDPAHWFHQAQVLLEGVRSVLTDHPGLAIVAAGQASSEVSLELLESLLGVLAAGGVTGRRAAWAADGLLGLAVTSALDAGPDEKVEEPPDGRDDAFLALPPDRFPLLSEVSAELAPERAGVRFRHTVQALLRGLQSDPG